MLFQKQRRLMNEKHILRIMKKQLYTMNHKYPSHHSSLLRRRGSIGRRSRSRRVRSRRSRSNISSRCGSKNILRLNLSLASLQVCKSPGLIVNLPHLFVSLKIEVPQLAARRGTQSLLEVRVQSTPSTSGLIAELVVLVQTTSTVSGLVLLVEVAEHRREARGESMFRVKGNGLLDCVVAQRIAVSKVFGDNAGARFVFLFEFVVVLVLGLSCLGGLATGDVVEGLGGLNVDGGGAQLGLVEE